MVAFFFPNQTSRIGELKGGGSKGRALRAAANLIYHTAVRCTVSVAYVA
jgi:hypothetical protein